MLGKELKKQLSKEDFRSWLSNRRVRRREDIIHEPKKLTEALDIVLSEVKNLRLGAVSGSTFTTDDMKKAFIAGADKKYWTKIYLTGVVSG